ncbi:transporter substrate-binding domain-containing protein [Marinomonas flavescens]|uniref:transporter substrate-binding domain-containing protein n=1 Tax=Marinomonas flavescens TaxID=2529379 RepID=UPI001054A0CD|nr:transporter substrate-binding domain-containing protein [Marinomonas flavescens]
MKNIFLILLMSFYVSIASASDGDLWKKSTLNEIVTRGSLQVCLDTGYLPFEMRDKKGRIVGFDVDIAKSMANAMNVKLDIRNTAWDGIIPALLTSKCDIIMSGMTITAQRNLKVNFVDPYIVIGQTVLISPKLKGIVKSYKDLNDPKYTIATRLGVTGEFVTKKYMSKAKLNLLETESAAVLEVINGKADAFVYDMPFNAIYASQNKGKIVHLDHVFTYEPLAWAIRKGDPDFMNFLNNYLAQVKGDGTYNKIYHKWFETDNWMSTIQ